MELGKKIRQLRFKAGLTQEQLAEKLGVAAQSVSKWENAVAMPDITALPLLAEIFGVSIDDLFDLTTEQRLNRSSIETPKVSARRGSVVISGIATAFSHLETDCAPMPSLSASCSCVNPALTRSCLIFFPSSISVTSLRGSAV